MKKIEIKDLFAFANNDIILNGLNSTVDINEINALMGPNGNGKSTLSSTIMGYPSYIVESEDILIHVKSILDKTVDERSKMGIFFAMQSPVEISGVLNLDFLKAIINVHRDPP